MVPERLVRFRARTILAILGIVLAVALAREIKAGLESGELEPTAAAIEPLADRLR